LGITLPYELCYTNILTILELAGLPFRSKERNENHPLLLGGGAGSFNPEPVADFFDAILLGDGEEAIGEIAAAVAANRSAGGKKSALLQHLAEIPGMYIPAHFPPCRASSDPPTAQKSMGHPSVRRRIISDLDDIEHLKRPLVPNARIIHDRLAIEIARGCTRGCRFCQAGITYRPVRERSPGKILDIAAEAIDHSGFEELALLSLSTGDYSCLEETLPTLMDHHGGDYVSVAMPSMRVGTLTPTIMEQVRRVRKSGFTLAPEAGSERLRRVINKGISEEDLLTTCEQAFALGWRVIKLYFMIGLPTETEEDIEAIAELVQKVLATRGSGTARGTRQVNISVGTFVPKPHTPFQWDRQISFAESSQLLRRLRQIVPRKGCELKYHSPATSFLEGVFSRGDRELARLIETAWHSGARLDGWDEHFNLALWQQAAQECKIDLDAYLRKREFSEALPWEHLETGVDRGFLLEERRKAEREAYTPDCRFHQCQGCGLCDFDTLQPVVHNRQRFAKEGPAVPKMAQPVKAVPEDADSHFRYLVEYSRTGSICHLGHLEILQVVFRSLRRAGIPTNFSQGFNPSPKISFSPALASGTESLVEYFIMDLKAPLTDPQETLHRLNNCLIAGLEVRAISPHNGHIPQKISTRYQLTLPRAVNADERLRLATFIHATEFFVTRKRKGRVREIDIRPLITSISIIADDTVDLEMVTAAAEAGAKPIEAVTAILGLDRDTTMATRILKTAWAAVE
ncbi:MAG: TIGR03960 family B12-binding radical SAM protein, partial [Desulforhopalus sp.]|nr:TIGR03960 family B12-binding radical SAM protein [Desulforhopalus sp.]